VKDWGQAPADLSIPFQQEGLLQSDGAPGPVFLALTTPQLVAAPWEVAVSTRHNWLVRVGSGRADGFVPELFRARLESGPFGRLIVEAAKPFGESPAVTVFAPGTDEAESIAQQVGGTASLEIRRSDIVFTSGPMYSTAGWGAAYRHQVNSREHMQSDRIATRTRKAFCDSRDARRRLTRPHLGTTPVPEPVRAGTGE